MTINEMTIKIAAFEKAGVTVLDGIHLASRGKLTPLNLNLELVNGDVAIIARPVRETKEATKPATTAKPASRR